VRLSVYEATNSHPADKAQVLSAKTAPDNTGRKVQDRSGATLTSGDQSESEADRTLTQRIRQAVVEENPPMRGLKEQHFTRPLCLLLEFYLPALAPAVFLEPSIAIPRSCTSCVNN
jgi:hypothetical protein